MKDKIVILLISLLTIGIFVGGALLVSKKSPPALVGAKDAKLEIVEKNFDWQEIDYDKGIVKHSFKIKNVGTSVLELANLQTNCMCTTAKVIIKNQNGEMENSPAFGMHSASSWVGKISPNLEAEIEVAFDPAFHGPQGVGPVARIISFSTNDPENPAVELNLTGTVVKK